MILVYTTTLVIKECITVKLSSCNKYHYMQKNDILDTKKEHKYLYKLIIQYHKKPNVVIYQGYIHVLHAKE